MIKTIISVDDIAQEIQSLLGEDKFRIIVDNNADFYQDIREGETLESQGERIFDGRVIGLMTSIAGELVGLPDLFSTSFGFGINFLTPTNKNIEDDLNNLTDLLNGSLHDLEEGGKFLMTFSTPSASGNVEVYPDDEGSEYYQQILLTGNVAITTGSIFGNELTVKWGGVDLTPLLINTDLNLGMEMSEQGTTDASLIPQSDYVSASSTATLTLHMRKEGTGLWSKVLGYILSPNNLKGTHEVLKFIPKGDEENSYTWNSAKILGINTVLAIGGYVMVSITFQNFEVIE